MRISYIAFLFLSLNALASFGSEFYWAKESGGACRKLPKREAFQEKEKKEQQLKIENLVWYGKVGSDGSFPSFYLVRNVDSAKNAFMMAESESGCKSFEQLMPYTEEQLKKELQRKQEWFAGKDDEENPGVTYSFREEAALRDQACRQSRFTILYCSELRYLDIVTAQMSQTPRNTPKHEFYKKEFTVTMANSDSLDTKGQKFKLSVPKREDCQIGTTNNRQNSLPEKFFKTYEANCRETFAARKQNEHFNLLGPLR